MKFFQSAKKIPPHLRKRLAVIEEKHGAEWEIARKSSPHHSRELWEWGKEWWQVTLWEPSSDFTSLASGRGVQACEVRAGNAQGVGESWLCCSIEALGELTVGRTWPRSIQTDVRWHPVDLERGIYDGVRWSWGNPGPGLTGMENLADTKVSEANVCVCQWEVARHPQGHHTGRADHEFNSCRIQRWRSAATGRTTGRA